MSREVKAQIAEIDEDGDNAFNNRVGLSAMQLRNLGVERRSQPLNAHSLTHVIDSNERGFFDGQDFGYLIVSSKNKAVESEVYNAFGTRAIGGSGVRISRSLAESLGVKCGDTMWLQKFN